MAILETVTSFLGAGEKAGAWDIKKMLGLHPSETPSQNDPEYIRDVKNQMTKEYDWTVNALQQLDQNRDQDLAKIIIDAYNYESSLWGDPNAPSRNVANPAQLQSTINNVIATATKRGEFSPVVEAGNSILQGTAAIITAPIQALTGTSNNTALLIVGIIIFIIFVVMKRRKT